MAAKREPQRRPISYATSYLRVFFDDATKGPPGADISSFSETTTEYAVIEAALAEMFAVPGSVCDVPGARRSYWCARRYLRTVLYQEFSFLRDPGKRGVDQRGTRRASPSSISVSRSTDSPLTMVARFKTSATHTSGSVFDDTEIASLTATWLATDAEALDDFTAAAPKSAADA